MRNSLIYPFSVLAFSSITFLSCHKKEETTPVRKNIENAVFVSGFVTQENEYVISANVSGILQDIYVSEGNQVGQNQNIAIIKSDVQNTQLQDAKVVNSDAQENLHSSAPQLSQLKTQISQAKNQFQNDKTNYLRYQDLRGKNSVSQLDLDKAKLQYEASQNNLIALQKNYDEVQNVLQLNAERTKIQISTQNAVLGDYRITSDNPGTVIQVSKKKGELVRPGETIATIGSGKYLLKMYVSEEDIVKVNLGQKVSVQLNTETNKTYSARVSKIYPGFEESEQSYIVEANFDKLPEKLFSGTQMQANIEISTKKNILVIPSKFISTGKYVTLSSGEQLEIKVGDKNAQWTEVLSGITENDKIILKD